MCRFLIVGLLFLLNACTTEYILVDEEVASNEERFMNFDNEEYVNTQSFDEQYELQAENEGRLISANDVFVVGEGSDFVTYQYKNVRVDEISPLASMYCADVALGGSPYLREVSIYHNGFMRATFDCVSIAM